MGRGAQSQPTEAFRSRKQSKELDFGVCRLPHPSAQQRRQANQAWLEPWIAKNGPLLFHVTDSEAKRQSILEQGLIPWNQLDSSLTRQHAGGNAYRPRAGHCYLATEDAILSADHLMEDEVVYAVAIDLRKLDPALFSPDEDAFVDPTLFMKPGLDIELKGETLFGNYQQDLENPFLAVKDIISEGPPMEDRIYDDYGQWAEANRLGDDPEHTKLSLEICGLLSHQGAIPASAIQEHVVLSRQAYDDATVMAAA